MFNMSQYLLVAVSQSAPDQFTAAVGFRPFVLTVVVNSIYLSLNHYVLDIAGYMFCLQIDL